jgi:hypothetical protein
LSGPRRKTDSIIHKGANFGLTTGLMTLPLFSIHIGGSLKTLDLEDFCLGRQQLISRSSKCMEFELRPFEPNIPVSQEESSLSFTSS